MGAISINKESLKTMMQDEKLDKNLSQLIVTATIATDAAKAANKPEVVLPSKFRLQSKTFFQWLIPVSYTHLDVYKRQIQILISLVYCRSGGLLLSERFSYFRSI